MGTEKKKVKKKRDLVKYCQSGLFLIIQSLFTEKTDILSGTLVREDAISLNKSLI